MGFCPRFFLVDLFADGQQPVLITRAEGPGSLDQFLVRSHSVWLRELGPGTASIGLNPIKTLLENLIKTP